MVGRSGSQAGNEVAMTSAATEAERQKGDRMFYTNIAYAGSYALTMHNAETTKMRQRLRKLTLASHDLHINRVTILQALTRQRKQQNLNSSKEKRQSYSAYAPTHIHYVVVLYLRMYVYGVGCRHAKRNSPARQIEIEATR